MNFAAVSGVSLYLDYLGLGNCHGIAGGNDVSLSGF